MSLERTCANFCMTAADQWKIDGAIIPTLWAIGDKRIIFAQPKNSDAWQNDNEQMAVHALMRSIVCADLIGVIAEAWVRQQEPNNPVPKKGDLEAIADTDPNVRTAIIVHGWDVKAKRSHSHMARLDLDTEGVPMWEFDCYDGAEGLAPSKLEVVGTCPLAVVADQTSISASVLEDWFILEAPHHA